MSTIHDLNKSILELSDSEAFELIKKRRFSRRMPKKVAKKKVGKKPKKIISVADALKSLTPAQKAALRKELLNV